jgi:hypothetical protein
MTDIRSIQTQIRVPVAGKGFAPLRWESYRNVSHNSNPIEITSESTVNPRSKEGSQPMGLSCDVCREVRHFFPTPYKPSSQENIRVGPLLHHLAMIKPTR